RRIFFEVKPALLSFTSIRTEDRLEGEGLRAGKGVDIKLKAVIHAVEFDGFAERRIDHARMSQNCGDMARHAVDPIESPDFLGRCVRCIADTGSNAEY